jgi:hypothetical protein
MHYLKVAWEHGHADEPVTLYSECDDAGWEVRKVEIFRDGRYGYASSNEHSEGSMLGAEPIPPIDEIAKRLEFHPAPITREEFEKIWAAARTNPLRVI